MLQLISQIPRLIWRVINAACRLVTAVLIVLYQTLFAESVTLSEDINSTEKLRLDNLRLNVQTGLNRSSINRQIQSISNELDWDDTKIAEVKREMYRELYQKQINEFIEFNDELYGLSSPDRIEILQQFQNLLNQARSSFNQTELSGYWYRYINKIQANGQSLYQLEDQSLPVVQSQIRQFRADLNRIAPP